MNIWGERLILVSICPDTGSLSLFYFKYHLQKPWSLQGSSGENPWTLARSSAQLCCDVVCAEAIAV